MLNKETPGRKEALPAQSFSWTDFLNVNQLFHTLHPTQWNLQWSKLKMGQRCASSGDEGCRLTGDIEKHRTGVKSPKAQESSWDEEYWQVVEQDPGDRPTAYRNPSGCVMRLTWGDWDIPFPIERNECGYRWVLVAHNLDDAIYWCPQIDYFYVNNKAMPRRDLITLLNTDDWCDLNWVAMINKALKMPVTRIGRYFWQARHPTHSARA